MSEGLKWHASWNTGLSVCRHVYLFLRLSICLMVSLFVFQSLYWSDGQAVSLLVGQSVGWLVGRSVGLSVI